MPIECKVCFCSYKNPRGLKEHFKKNPRCESQQDVNQPPTGPSTDTTSVSLLAEARSSKEKEDEDYDVGMDNTNKDNDSTTNLDVIDN